MCSVDVLPCNIKSDDYANANANANVDVVIADKVDLRESSEDNQQAVQFDTENWKDSSNRKGFSKVSHQDKKSLSDMNG